MNEIPDGCFFDAESFSRAGDTNAGIIVDEAVRSDFGEKTGSFLANGSLGSEARRSGGEFLPAHFKEMLRGPVSVGENGIG